MLEIPIRSHSKPAARAAARAVTISRTSIQVMNGPIMGNHDETLVAQDSLCERYGKRKLITFTFAYLRTMCLDQRR